MSDLLLAKPVLPEGFIDLSVGEPYLVRECLEKLVELRSGHLKLDDIHLEYPTPTGYKPLIKVLEDKHGAPIIITNGAKQALAAIFYSLKRMGKDKVGMKLPYWALIPPLANSLGVDSVFTEPDASLTSKNFRELNFEGRHDSYLLLAPNNPDGQCQSLESLKEIAASYDDEGTPFIHDAAYFTHTYLPNDYDLGPLGDAQIFSISKMYGLSGLRIGYIVCHNTTFLKYIQEYMEMTTVGVSTISQQFLLNLLNWEPDYSKEFLETSHAKLVQAKKLVKAIPAEILEIPENIEEIPGMFLWAKVGPKANFKKSKVNMIDGALFGKPGYVRMNLAINQEKLIEVISRLIFF